MQFDFADCYRFSGIQHHAAAFTVTAFGHVSFAFVQNRITRTYCIMTISNVVSAFLSLLRAERPQTLIAVPWLAPIGPVTAQLFSGLYLSVTKIHIFSVIKLIQDPVVSPQL